MSVDAYSLLPSQHLVKESPMMDGLAEHSQSSMPPLNNLPQWSRLNTLDKARYPKPFCKDRLMSQKDNHSVEDTEDDNSAQEEVDADLVEAVNPQQRIEYLERSIQFLQAQHYELLTNLQDELEKVKRHNKELQFRMIIAERESQDISGPPTVQKPVSRVDSSPQQSQAQPHSARSSSSNNDSARSSRSNKNALSDTYLLNKPDLPPHPPTVPRVSRNKEKDMKTLLLEEEVKDLKKRLREENKKNHYLSQILDQNKRQHTQQLSENLHDDRPAFHGAQPLAASHHLHEHHHGSSGPARVSQAANPLLPSATDSDLHAAESLPFGATFNPLQVHIPSQASRPPTMHEVEVIIKHLHSKNERQAHELTRLKSDLKDVLYSHKWTPDAYLLAKAYVSDDKLSDTTKLPLIPRPPATRKMPDVSHMQSDSLSLPALTQTMGNKAVERRKRTQILQKARFKKEVLQ